MIQPNLIIMYVEDTFRSQTFYAQLFGQSAQASFPTYVAFEFKNGIALGLWSIQAKNFTSAGTGNRSELSIMVDNDGDVTRLHDTWMAAGITIEQPLDHAVFGLTFVALDPDGHRIRVCTPDD